MACWKYWGRKYILLRNEITSRDQQRFLTGRQHKIAYAWQTPTYYSADSAKRVWINPNNLQHLSDIVLLGNFFSNNWSFVWHKHVCYHGFRLISQTKRRYILVSVLMKISIFFGGGGVVNEKYYDMRENNILVLLIGYNNVIFFFNLVLMIFFLGGGGVKWKYARTRRKIMLVYLPH